MLSAVNYYVRSFSLCHPILWRVLHSPRLSHSYVFSFSSSPSSGYLNSNLNSYSLKYIAFQSLPSSSSLSFTLTLFFPFFFFIYTCLVRSYPFSMTPFLSWLCSVVYLSIYSFLLFLLPSLSLPPSSLNDLPIPFFSDSVPLSFSLVSFFHFL